MLDQHGRGTEAKLNRARHAVDGAIREARELWELGYTSDDRWVCVDDNCRVRMVPCAWQRPNDQGQFCNEHGQPHKHTAYFRAEPSHSPGCRASFFSSARDHRAPEFHIGPPARYPNHVILFQDGAQCATSTNEREAADAQRMQQGGPERRHAHSVRGIKAACEYYADHPDQHCLRLRVDRCPGETYGDCFVKLGTGELSGVAKNWIFFDEIRFTGRIDFEAEPLVLPLLSNVDRLPRRLVIPTADWLPSDSRLEFRTQIKTTLATCRAAHREGGRERPWIFFFGREARYDNIEFRAELQSGVALLVRAMPRTWGRYRPSMHFDVSAKHPAPLQQSEAETPALKSEPGNASAQREAEAEPQERGPSDMRPARDSESSPTNIPASTHAANVTKGQLRPRRDSDATSETGRRPRASKLTRTIRRLMSGLNPWRKT